MKIIITLMILFTVSCSNTRMDSCRRMCGLAGVKHYDNNKIQCICNSIVKVTPEKKEH